MDDVLVVGAGPVGLVAACELARQGAPVRVVERRDTPNTQSRAVVVHPRSQEMFAALGALPALEARARRLRGAEMRDSGGTERVLAGIDLTGLDTRHPSVLSLPQDSTEEVLRERAAAVGITVETGTELTALTQDPDGVDVTLRTADGERTTRAGWVVGADGAHSVVRDLVGTRLEGRFHGQHFVLADVDVETALTADVMRMWAHPAGLALSFPMAGARTRLMFLVDPPERDDPTAERVQALVDARMGGRYTVRAAHWLTRFEVRHGQVPEYRIGRVLLAGDAAHIHSPAGGQGMNTGMQDAANLAWKLALVAAGRADAVLLDSYQAERHPVGAAVVTGTTALTDLVTSTGASAVARRAGLFLLGHVPAAGHAAARRLAELTVGYRHGPLAAQHGGRVHAGDHAPDPDGLTRGDGTPVAIEDLLRSPGFLLLGRTGDPGSLDALRGVLGDLGTVMRVAPAAGGPDTLVDRDGTFARHYGLGEDGLALIRPDGYLGLVAASADPALLADYLARILHVGAPAPRPAEGARP